MPEKLAMKQASPTLKLQARVARSLVRMPSWLLRLAIGKSIVREDQILDPQVQLLIRLQALVRRKSPQDVPIDKIRAFADVQSSVFTPEVSQLARVEPQQFDGPDGPIPGRLYRPVGLNRGAPGLLFMHGGGFTVGSLDSHDGVCRYLAAHTPCIVVSIDYRLAPEHPYPAGVEDAVAAFRELARNASRYGIDPQKIAVGGDSAGATLAAVVAQRTRTDTLHPCAQLLFYPSTDATMSFPSIQTFGSGFLLDKMMMDWFIGNYLKPGQNPRDPGVSPLYGEFTEDLAPAAVITGGFDPLRDEGEAYADRLSAAGVAVWKRRHPSLVHGFLNMCGEVHGARAAVDDTLSILRGQLGVN